MSTNKPRILIVGAGMSGLAAAHKLHTSSGGAFDLHVAEAGDRIGGRIDTSVFCGDRVELGATWIHGIQGSPVYEIAEKVGSLESGQPWECMDGAYGGPTTVLENGYVLHSGLVESVSKYFDFLMGFAHGKGVKEIGGKCCEMAKRGCDFKQNGVSFCEIKQNGVNCCEMAKMGFEFKQNGVSFCEMDKNGFKINGIAHDVMNYCEIAKRGFEIKQNGVDCCEMEKKGSKIEEIEQKEMNYCEMAKRAYESCVKNGGFGKISIGVFLTKGLELYVEEVKGLGDFDRESILEAVFEMKENTQRTYTSADDLANLDFEAESEYKLFPGEEITIAKGYMSVIESLASVLPDGCVKLGEKVIKIEWRSEDGEGLERDLGGEIRAVKVTFSNGSYMFADHVILTVSLGVLKAGVCEKPCLFEPPLPSFKIDAISRLGYGVVNKLFMEFKKGSENKFPFLQMAFHKTDSEFRDPKVPLWMRKTNTLYPIYGNSNVVLSWFAGKEALELESLEDEDIIDGVSKTLSCFSIKSAISASSSFGKVLKTRWGKDPLFLGSYSYVAVGSSCDDLDTMAMPLPEKEKNGKFCFPFQLLFAGEATHRTHYSTTHGAYFSGLREANRLLRHYGL